MKTVKFLRNTHAGGRHRRFPPEACQFWRTPAGIVGAVLRPETPLTLAEVVEECRTYAAECSEDGFCFDTDEKYVAWC